MSHSLFKRRSQRTPRSLVPRFLALGLAIAVLPFAGLLAQQTPSTAASSQSSGQKTPQELLANALGKIINLIEPAQAAAPQIVEATIKVVEATGQLKTFAGRTAEGSFQAPDKFTIAAAVEKRELAMGRNGQQLWLYAPGKKFGIVGSPDVARYATAPDRKDGTVLAPIKLPLPKEQIFLFAAMLQVEALPSQDVDAQPCKVLRAKLPQQTADMFGITGGEMMFWLRETDNLPVRLSVNRSATEKLTIELQHLKVSPSAAPGKWSIPAAQDAKVETVALSHVTHFIPAAMSLLDQKVPSLGPATGSTRVLAREGAGRLEDHDGTKVLFLKGTPEEMGKQHGTLLRKQVRDLVSKVLYGVGVGSSFEKGRWFFGEIEEAQKRLMPFMDERYIREMDAMALASGNEKEEIRLSNFFPELFHCSGFSVYGKATVGGRMFHGRILDYLRGVGLEPNAVVIVHQPEQGNAWVNISYAGFVGSVTAMNAKHISIGEMGGRGEGNWDGKPMAQLMREVMEKASTLEEAVAIMRKGPRTCEYYYVISDGNTRKAVGIAATATTFDIVEPGKPHPRLPHAFEDAVLMSAGDRYEKLSERVKDTYGKLDADGAMRLMDRPVCMNSNIHSVLFAPDTLDFWVANADSKNVASHTRYTHYNLADLLKPEAASSATASIR